MWRFFIGLALFALAGFMASAQGFHASSMPIIGKCDLKGKAEIVVSNSLSGDKIGTEYDVYFTISRIVGKGKPAVPLGTAKQPKGEMFRIGTIKIDSDDFNQDIPFEMTAEHLGSFTVPEASDREWSRSFFVRIDTLLINTKTKGVLKFDEPRGAILHVERVRGDGIKKVQPLWAWVAENAKDPKKMIQQLDEIEGYLPLTNQLDKGYIKALMDADITAEHKLVLLNNIPDQVVHSKMCRDLWVLLVTLAETETDDKLKAAAKNKLDAGAKFWADRLK